MNMPVDLTGKSLGPYQLVRQLGRGGMGVVYAAYQPKLTRYVALKVLPRRYTDNPQFVARFWQEARIAARLQHPHILSIFDYGEYEGYHYIAMPLVRDGSLAQLLQGRPLGLEQIGYIITQVGGALDYAHSQDVIHRDVKPDNILISRQSGCLLTDFGIAKLLESTVQLTQEGVSFGTPAYMSPEQIRGDEDLDGRSDLYSLGVVLYQMATGQLPFSGSVDTIRYQHLYQPPPPPRDLNANLPRRLAEVILKSLAKTRDGRYASVGELVHALQAALPGGVMAGSADGEAILGAPPGPEEREAEARSPMDEEELTAVLRSTSGATPAPAEAPGPAGEAEPRAGALTHVDLSRSVAGPLRKISVIGWAVALVLVAAVAVGAIWLRRPGLPSAAPPLSSTPVPIAAQTEAIPPPPAPATPTAWLTRASPPKPSPTDTATPEPTRTETLAPTESPSPSPEPSPTHTTAPPASPTRVPTGTPTPKPTATATQTPTPRLSPTGTPTASRTVTPTVAPPPASDLSGRLAIPLMYGNEPKVYVVSTSGELLNTVGAARQPDYSLDGTRLIVNGEWGEWNKLRVLNGSGGDPFEIGDPSLAGHSYPAWSPDSTQVIYEDGTLDPRGWRIFIREPRPAEGDAGAGTILTAGVGRGELIGRNPLWTGRDRFIFRGCNTWEPGRESDCGIWAMQGNGGEPRQLTASPNHVPSDVLADMVVYVSPENGDWSVYTLNLASGAVRQITADGANEGLPTISPDGRSIAFVSDREGRLAAWRVSIEGGSPRKLFDIPAEWGTLRPDGWGEEKMSWGKGS